jgi:small subunit ribosomal protein S1
MVPLAFCGEIPYNGSTSWGRRSNLRMDEVKETGITGAAEGTPAGPVAPENLMDQLLTKSYDLSAPQVGTILDGTIVSVSESEVLVDVGAKTEGVISGRELERMPAEDRRNLKVGNKVLVYVLKPENKDGHIVLSLSKAQQERDWREAERLLQSQEVFQVAVAGYNRGGLVARIGKVRGFIPASQLVSVHRFSASSVARDEEDVEIGDVDEGEEGISGKEGELPWVHLVGQRLWVKVIELDRHRNRLILSERRALPEWRREQKERLLSELQRGDVRKGVVTSLQPFGAFVDLGGADGLIHLSELSWSKVNHPSEVLQVGQEVEVYVLNVDRERRRIGLSLRRLRPEPWSTVPKKFKVGQVVEGTITKLVNFGAFARVDDGVEGLIHISELSKHRVGHPREVVQEGQTLPMRIIRIDPARRRMGLSLSRVAEEEYAEYDWQEADEDEIDSAKGIEELGEAENGQATVEMHSDAPANAKA